MVSFTDHYNAIFTDRLLSKTKIETFSDTRTFSEKSRQY